MRTLNKDITKATQYEVAVDVELPDGSEVTFELAPLTGEYLDALFKLEGEVQKANSGGDVDLGEVGKEVFELLKAWFTTSISPGENVSEDDYHTSVDVILRHNYERMLEKFVEAHVAPSKRKQIKLLKEMSKKNE